MSLTNEEVRFLSIQLLTAETERDRQTRVGASDLANQCDRCLAAALAGQKERSAITDRYWLGARLGTAMSLLFEERADGKDTLEAEKHVFFGDIPGYGRVGGSIDLLEVKERQVIDWKGATRQDIALLEDYLQSQGLWRADLPPRWEKQKDTTKYEGGYKFKIDSNTVVSLSARAYAEKMAKMVSKMGAYYGQLNLYCHSGVADRGSVVFFARNGNGMYDNPGLDNYDNQAFKHDIFVWSFDYDRAYAEALLARAGDIWALLQSGRPISSFESHEHCFTCEQAQWVADDVAAPVVATIGAAA